MYVYSCTHMYTWAAHTCVHTRACNTNVCAHMLCVLHVQCVGTHSFILCWCMHAHVHKHTPVSPFTHEHAHVCLYLSVNASERECAQVCVPVSVCCTCVYMYTAIGGAAAEAGERQAAGAEVHLAAGGEWQVRPRRRGRALTGGRVGVPLTSPFPSLCSRLP